MIFKYLVLSLIALILVTASDPFFGFEFSTKPAPEEKGDVKEMSWMTTDNFKDYLLDSDNRVNDAFKVTDYYYPTVHFWFLIYTQFDSSQVVIHDKANLNLIYKVLDFSSLHEKALPKNTLYVLQNKISDERVDKLKEDFKFLAKNPYSLEPEAKSLYRTLQSAGIQLPISKLERQALFNTLRANLRTQTGQRNFIREGIIRSLPYKKFLHDYLKAHHLPIELTAIPFLESSFNPNAESRVGALGTWQFMPLIASYYLPKRSLKPTYDYRSNVGTTSIAGAYLMKENFKIMKSWDMAVTAYNSGTKHLLKTKRELASTQDDIDLEDIIKNSDSAHFGFASKNFYSEFLALAHSLAYEEELFSGLHKSDRPDVHKELQFYLLKCSIKPGKFLTKDQWKDVEYHNHQVKDDNTTYPKGFIITAKSDLPKNKFLKLSFNQISDTKPKDWGRFLKNQSCSTK